MELTNLIQIESEDLNRLKIDCMISASGTQSRCLYLAEKFANKAGKKILLTSGSEDQKQNRFLPVFAGYGFSNHSAKLNDVQAIDRLLQEVCNVHKEHLNILVDYSCMPKKWYALFIDGLTRNNFPVSSIHLYLSYTPKVFEKKAGKQSVGYFGPIINNRDNLKDKKPVSMIVALDHNHNTVMEAINKVKPRKVLAFIPHCTHDPEYARLVQENNKSLLERIDTGNIIRYQADRPEEINTLLTSCCLDERVDSEVVIVPQGPKTFSMMSMLLSARYPDVKLWEIIINDLKINPEHGQPAANPVIVKVSFVNDELD
jgi:hypothetical protein